MFSRQNINISQIQNHFFVSSFVDAASKSNRHQWFNQQIRKNFNKYHTTMQSSKQSLFAIKHKFSHDDDFINHQKQIDSFMLSADNINCFFERNFDASINHSLWFIKRNHIKNIHHFTYHTSFDQRCHVRFFKNDRSFLYSKRKIF